MAEKQPKCDIPQWLLSADDYVPPADKEAFLHKTMLSILAKLTLLRQNSMNAGQSRYISPAFKLFFVFLTVLLVASSVKSAFPLLVLALLLVYLACQKASFIAPILKTGAAASAFTFIIVLPSLFLGNERIFILPLKVFITVSLLKCFVQNMPFYELSRTMRSFGISSAFILIFELTLRYIVLLGQTASDLLISMRLRSVGRNNAKYSSLASVMGTTFLKSQRYSQYTYDAMRCRCFTGEYDSKGHFQLQPIHAVYAILIFIMLMLFLCLEGYI